MSSEEWVRHTLEEVADIIGGGTPSTINPEFWGEDISWITPKDMATINERYVSGGERDISTEGLNNSSARLLPKGTVLLTSRAPIGYLGIAKNEITTNQGFKSLIPKTDVVDSLFLFYLLKNNIEYIKSLGSGTTFAEISGGVLKQVVFDFPPFPEQHRIANILGSLDDKIELNRQMNKTLEAMAQAIFKSWFVDFDPVRAKMDGKQPAGMDAETAALFPDAMVGDVPRGWRVESLDNIASFLNGLALQKYPTDEDEFLPAIKIAQMHKGNSEGADKVSRNIPKEYIINDGDVLFSWSGSLSVMVWCAGEGALNQHLFKVTSEKYPKWFYYLWILNHLPDFQEIAAGKATTMGHIQRHHLTAAKVVVPNNLALWEIDKVISPILDRIISNNLETRTLTNLRDTLLPKLMSGEILVD